MRLTPGVPSMIVEHSNELNLVNGQLRVGVNKAIPPEVLEQYKQGYRCLNCDVAQEEPFPEECVETLYGICGYRIREKQLHDLEQIVRGERRYGPTPTDAEWLQEEREQERFLKRAGIWLP